MKYCRRKSNSHKEWVKACKTAGIEEFDIVILSGERNSSGYMKTYTLDNKPIIWPHNQISKDNLWGSHNFEEVDILEALFREKFPKLPKDLKEDRHNE